MQTMKLLRILALTLAITLLAAACGGDDGADVAEEPTTGAEAPTEAATEPETSGGGDGTLKLGYILPETGQLAFLGPPMIEAARFAVSQVNDAGGVLGEEIPDLVTGDEAGDEAIANQSADRLLSEDVDGILGAAASGMSLSIIDKITGASVVQCSGSNTAPTFTDYEDNGFYFRTAPTDALQGPVLAEVVAGDGNTNVAIAARADDYGRGLADATAAALEEQGATVVLNETYDPEGGNFDTVVQAIEGSNPDAIVLISFEEGAQILTGLIEAGLGPNEVNIYGADGLAGNVASAMGDPSVLEGMKGTRPAPAEDPNFLERLQEFAPDLEETTFAGQMYDCVNIIALAAEIAGSDAPEDFATEIVGVTKDGEKCSDFASCKELIDGGGDIDYDGASGPLEFIDAGEPGEATIEIYTFDNEGNVESLDSVQTSLPEES